MAGKTTGAALTLHRENEHTSSSDKRDHYSAYELDAEHEVIQVSHFVRVKPKSTKN